MKVVVAVIALALGVLAAYWLLLGREEAPVVDLVPKTPVLAHNAPASRPVGLTVKAGQVMRGEQALRPGDTVSIADELVTGAESSAVIGGGASTIELGADTKIALRGIDGDTVSFFVSGGTVAAASTGDKLQFFGAGTTGSVRIENAAARLLSDGARGLVVAGERGDVYVENAGQRVQLGPGQATRVSGEKAPDKTWKVPASMLLKVAWPKDTELAQKKLRVSGKATPHALLRVKNVRTIADENGDFVIEIPLAEGQNALSLSSDDAAGKHQESKLKVKVDTTPAEVGVETSPDMWKKKSE